MFLGIKANGYLIENSELLNNGDGLYFINEEGRADGDRVNIIVNDVVVPNNFRQLKVGTPIYRNYDAAFNRLLEREDATIRKIGVHLNLTESVEGFVLTAVDEDGHTSTATIASVKELTKTGESNEEAIKKNLAKSGNTPFIVDEITVSFSKNWFMPNSKVNELRREVLELLMETRVKEYHREERQIVPTDHPYPVENLDFTYNVSNKMARQFYHRHGVKEIEKAFELQWDPGKSRVMTTKSVSYTHLVNLLSKE